jgi:hypothetical protein
MQIFGGMDKTRHDHLIGAVTERAKAQIDPDNSALVGLSRECDGVAFWPTSAGRQDLAESVIRKINFDSANPPTL